MNQSESITELAKALLIFHKEVGKVSKDATNPFFKNRYASLSNIIEAIAEPLQKAGLSLIQLPSGENGITTRLIHESGEWIEETSIMPVKEVNNPQAVGSSITYNRRYSAAGLLMLQIDDDDDGNAASTPSKPTYTKPAPTKPTTPDEYQGLSEGSVITVQAVKSGVSAKGPWERVTTNVGPLFNNSSTPMQEGQSYEVVIINGAIKEARPAGEVDVNEIPF